MCFESKEIVSFDFNRGKISGQESVGFPENKGSTHKLKKAVKETVPLKTVSFKMHHTRVLQNGPFEKKTNGPFWDSLQVNCLCRNFFGLFRGLARKIFSDFQIHV